MLGLRKFWCRRSDSDATRIGAVVLGAFICAALTSCAVGPDYPRSSAAPTPPFCSVVVVVQCVGRVVHLRPRNGGGRCATANSIRWSSVRVAASPTLEIALDRLQQARAQEAVVIGAALPAAEWSAGGGWGTGSDLARGRASQTLISAENGSGVAQVVNVAGFDAAWELDIFGKFRRGIEAAQYDVEGAVAARNVVLISLIADVVRAYLDLRALQMQLAVLRKNIQVARKYVDFVQERFSRGITNELDVTLAQRELAQLQAQVAPLTAQIDAARYVIAVSDRRISRKSRQRAQKAGRASGLASSDPGGPADRSAAAPPRYRRSRTSTGERHGADRRRDRGSLSASGDHRGRGTPDRNCAVSDQPDLVSRTGFRRAAFLISAGSMLLSRGPTIVAANCCSPTSKQCLTLSARSIPRSMPMRRSRIACATSQTR